MCNVCKDWEIGKLTNKEAWRNLEEMVGDNLSQMDEHSLELANKIVDKMIEEQLNET